MCFTAGHNVLTLSAMIDTNQLIDRIATDLGVPAETRRKWRQRGAVPYKRRDEIREKAAQCGIAIPRVAFDNYGKEPAE